MNKILSIAIASTLLAGVCCRAETVTESFDSDPGWDALNNRPTEAPLKARQDFGWSDTQNASSTAGEIGGLITPAGEPAYFARPVGPFTFADKLSASGAMVVKPGANHVLLGFFNSETVNEWRAPNTLMWRINGRGETFHAHYEYASSRWRAGAGVIGRYDAEADRMHAVENPAADRIYAWSLQYEPGAPDEPGRITATFGEETSMTTVSPEIKADGATFNRFGILNVVKSLDGAGELWVGDLTINGEAVDLSKADGWEGRDNRREYETDDVRPWFNFGWSATRHAGGAAAGELGGRFFRGDCREPHKLACYGAPLETLTLDKPLHASGRVVLRRGVSDSTTLIGFFNRDRSLRVNDSQKHALPSNFAGVSVEGPSAQGFYAYPVFRGEGDFQAIGSYDQAPRIMPDGASHAWTFDYDPAGAEGRGAITVTLDGAAITIELPEGAKADPAAFDRFGLVTPWIDGNEQIIFFDDITYTRAQK